MTWELLEQYFLREEETTVAHILNVIKALLEMYVPEELKIDDIGKSY